MLCCTRTVLRADTGLLKKQCTNPRRLRALVPAALFGTKVRGQGYSYYVMEEIYEKIIQILLFCYFYSCRLAYYWLYSN